MDLGRALLPAGAAVRETARSRPDCRFRAAGRTARPSGRRQSPFEGSPRQVRGAVVEALRTQRSASAEALAERTGHPARAIAIATASRSCVTGSSSGPVRAGFRLAVSLTPP